MALDDLTTCCGLYGGHCARHVSFTAFRAAAAMLAEIVDAHNFRHWLPEAVARTFDYGEFRKGLDFFADEDSWLVCRTCCGDDAGPPNCPASCCHERGLDVCFDCDDFPCDRLAGSSDIAARAEEYRRLGRDAWLREQATRAAHGYELHTRKYYTVRADDAPPCEA